MLETIINACIVISMLFGISVFALTFVFLTQVW
jgi:hypothetical protein